MSALRLRKTRQGNNPKVETKRDNMVKCLTKKKGKAADTEETLPASRTGPGTRPRTGYRA